jgi:hypothetical protein
MSESPRRSSLAARKAAEAQSPRGRQRVLVWVALGIGITAVAAGVFLAWKRMSVEYEYRIERGQPGAAVVVVQEAGAPDRVAERFSFDLPSQMPHPGKAIATIKQSGSKGPWEVTLGTEPETGWLTATVRRNGHIVPASAEWEAARRERAEQAKTENVRADGRCYIRYSQFEDDSNRTAFGRAPKGLKPHLAFVIWGDGVLVDQIQIPDPPLAGEQTRDDGTWVRWDLVAGRYEAKYRGVAVPVAAEHNESLHGEASFEPGKPPDPGKLLLPRLDTDRFVRMRDNPMYETTGGAMWTIEIVERAELRVVSVINIGLGSISRPPDVRKAPGDWSLVVYKDRIVPLEQARLK